MKTRRGTYENRLWVPRRRRKTVPQDTLQTQQAQPEVSRGATPIQPQIPAHQESTQPPEPTHQEPTANSDRPAESPPVNQGQADVSLKDALDKLYSDIKSAPSFSAKINDFLRKNSVHSVHKRIVKKKFPRRKTIRIFQF